MKLFRREKQNVIKTAEKIQEIKSWRFTCGVMKKTKSSKNMSEGRAIEEEQLNLHQIEIESVLPDRPKLTLRQPVWTLDYDTTALCEVKEALEETNTSDWEKAIKNEVKAHKKMKLGKELIKRKEQMQLAASWFLKTNFSWMVNLKEKKFVCWKGIYMDSDKLGESGLKSWTLKYNNWGSVHHMWTLAFMYLQKERQSNPCNLCWRLNNNCMYKWKNRMIWNKN